ncbi:hypothetical protein Bra471DRAFT_02076 [Bradyrhizobium sp. WSM471]|nr:hypothetical protein Bra471DRAFT_02076 [Bradyrhizobium sp. WSM471]
MVAAAPVVAQAVAALRPVPGLPTADRLRARPVRPELATNLLQLAEPARPRPEAASTSRLQATAPQARRKARTPTRQEACLQTHKLGVTQVRAPPRMGCQSARPVPGSGRPNTPSVQAVERAPSGFAEQRTLKAMHTASACRWQQRRWPPIQTAFPVLRRSKRAPLTEPFGSQLGHRGWKTRERDRVLRASAGR